MNAKIRQRIEGILDGIDPVKYNRISQKLLFTDGRELVINMIYNRLEEFPAWTFANALDNTEIYLKGLENE